MILNGRRVGRGNFEDGDNTHKLDNRKSTLEEEFQFGVTKTLNSMQCHKHASSGGLLRGAC